MTEQEVEVLVARLTRIWSPEKKMEWEFAPDGQTPAKHFDCFAELSSGIGFEYFWWHRLNSFMLEVSKSVPFQWGYGKHIIVGRLRCSVKSGQIESHFPIQLSDNKELRSVYDQFAAQYLYPFRRGCWLSGCPIEATAHQKAEWMQDFTREEIQAWNLKY